MIIERTTVHVSDDAGRIAMLETRTVGDAIDDHGTAEELTRYIYSNHLQSASLELDESGAIISYEEYHPYGTTSYQAMIASIHAVAKRYRYTGKERDEESGLYYHGARYYIPWLCRWIAVDPLESEYSPWSPYHYVKCNPIIDTDSTGMSGDKDPPKGYYKVGSMWDSFDDEGNNKYGQLGGWVDIKETGDYKYYTNEEYLYKFGGNKKFRPSFSGTVNIAGESPGINNGRILHHDGTIEKTRTYGSTSVPSKEIKPKPTITTIQEKSKTIENIELTKIPIEEKQETVLQSNGGDNDEKWLATEIAGAFSNGTMVIDGAFNFVEHSKTGRFLANGYQHISKAEMAQSLKLAKPLTRGIAGVNLISQTISVADDFSHGRWKSGTTRGVVNGIILGVTAVNPLLGFGFGLGVAEALWVDYLYEYAEKNW